jgi:secondary thiamine-phosphate synthase enzyme
MKHVFENHDLATTERGQFIDLTDDLRNAVARSEVVNGTALIYSPHTTCAVMINEPESGFFEDFRRLLDTLVPSAGRYYQHDDSELRTEGIEDDTFEFPNGHSHCRAALLGSSSQAIPIVDGELLLGRWQKVFFCELDRARARKVYIQVTGE